MKKVLAVLFCFVYLLSSAGVNLHFHICGGKIRTVSLFDSDEADCCGMKMKKKDCCEEKIISYQIKDNQNRTYKAVNLKPLEVVAVMVCAKSCRCKPTVITKNNATEVLEPPDIGESSLFLRNGVFRI